MEEGYSDIPHSNYEEWKTNTMGRAFNLDGSYGCQCLTADHMVLMYDYTLKDVKDIKVGDKLSTGNTVITNTPCFTDVYKVYTKTNVMTVSKDHRFILDDNSECYVKDCVGKNLKINLEQNKVYDLTSSELKFLGFYLGDGTKHYRRNSSTKPEIFVTVGTPQKEEYLLNLGINFKVRLHSNGKAKVFGLINREHPKLVQIIHELDGKKLPLTFDKDQYADIIDGYIHADGCKKRKQYVCSSIDKELLLSIQYGCFLNNWQAKLSEKVCRKKTNLCEQPKPIYRLSINKLREPQAKVLKVKYIGKESVYVLNTDGDHLYYADNIKHHNCWDYASLFWRNVGFPVGYPLTGGLHYAYQTWTVSRLQNSSYNGNQYFQLIEGIAMVKKGDVIVIDGNAINPPGHICFADEDYDGSGYLWCVGQNQGGTVLPGGGTAVTRNHLGTSLFLGAFRYIPWQTSPSGAPVHLKKKKFPWVLYARKLRNSR